LGNQLPVNTGDAKELFVSIVLFTGFILLSYSIYRLPFAIIYALVRGGSASYESAKDVVIYAFNKDKSRWRYAKFVGSAVLRILVTAIYLVTLLPLLLFIFGKWIDDVNFHQMSQNQLSTASNERVKKEHLIKSVVRFFDRLGIIGITFWATLPQMTPQVKIIGLLGLGFAILIYLIRGDFSFVLKDNIGEQDKTVFPKEKTG
jgi:hypothetical protein